jgi:chromate reductase
MSEKSRILCFAGSLRRGSLNKKLVKVAMSGAAETGAQVTFVDLADYPMPLYDGDIEEAKGLPEEAKRLKQLMKSHQAFLISSPEYNSSISGALKNAIDWASRPEPGEKQLECFKGKIAGIMAASPGALGGLRGLVTVRSILENIGVMVIPDQIAISQANDAFDSNDNLTDQKKAEQVKQIGRRVAEVAERLVQPAGTRA